MDFYEQNINKLKSYKENIYEKIQEYLNNNDKKYIDDVYSIDTKDNVKALMIKKNNIEYRMNSSFYPVKEAEKWIKQYTFYNYNNVIIMFGLGNGIFAEKIITSMNDEDRLIIYEPSFEIFKHVLKEYDMEKLIIDCKVELVVEDEHLFHTMLRKYVNITNVRTKIVCSHPKYQDIFSEAAIAFWKELKDNDTHLRISVNADLFFNKVYIDNMFTNFRYLSKSIGLVNLSKILPREIPVILVAAGPSVENNIESLKKAKGKSIIIAVDRVLDYLLDNNVEPDIIATLDPVKPIKLFSKRDNISIPLLCIVESSVEVLEKHKGRKIFCSSSRFPHKMFLTADIDLLGIDVGTSVATMTFASILLMGFETIILVGQDLAYNGEFTHAGQVIDDDITTDRLVTGLDGKQINSRCDWYEFIVWYQDMIKLHPNINVFDTKSRGAKIEGTILKPLDEIMKDYTMFDNDIIKLINEIEPRFNSKQMKVMWDFLNECKSKIKTMQKKAKKGYKLSLNLINECKKERDITISNEAWLKEIKKINKEIMESDVYFLLENYMMSIMSADLTLVYVFSEDEKKNKIQTYTLSKNMFQCIDAACDYIMPKFVNLNMEEFMYGEKRCTEKI